MAQHDMYEKDILKALQNIARSLDKIEKKIPDQKEIIDEVNKIGTPQTYSADDIKKGMDANERCKGCVNYYNLSFTFPCNVCNRMHKLVGTEDMYRENGE